MSWVRYPSMTCLLTCDFGQQWSFVLDCLFNMDENFPGKPRFLGFSSDFQVFHSGCSHSNLKKKKIYRNFLSTLDMLKCNTMSPKALKLYLQSIKLQKSFYSSNFLNFTCMVMLWFAKFQVFFASTILVPDLRTSKDKCINYRLILLKYFYLLCMFFINSFFCFAFSVSW
jgi:hypothetical protein